MADELDWLEMLVASERVEKWLGTICSNVHSSAARCVACEGRLLLSALLAYQPIGFGTCRILALQELAAAVQAKEAYAEEVSIQIGIPTVH